MQTLDLLALKLQTVYEHDWRELPVPESGKLILKLPVTGQQALGIQTLEF